MKAQNMLPRVFPCLETFKALFDGQAGVPAHGRGAGTRQMTFKGSFNQNNSVILSSISMYRSQALHRPH